MTTAYEGMPDQFTLDELVDLALCTPEVGAVNFNILRILLREIIRNTDLSDVPAYTNDVETAQINNFKNYMQGIGSQSPIPGVVNLNSVGTSIGDRGATYQRLPSRILKQPLSAREPLQQPQQGYQQAPPGFNQQQLWNPPPGFQQVPPPPGFYQQPQEFQQVVPPPQQHPVTQLLQQPPFPPQNQPSAPPIQKNMTASQTSPGVVNQAGQNPQHLQLKKAQQQNATGQSQTNPANTPTNTAGTQAIGPPKPGQQKNAANGTGQNIINSGAPQHQQTLVSGQTQSPGAPLGSATGQQQLKPPGTPQNQGPPPGFQQQQGPPPPQPPPGVQAGGSPPPGYPQGPLPPNAQGQQQGPPIQQLNQTGQVGPGANQQKHIAQQAAGQQGQQGVQTGKPSQQTKGIQGLPVPPAGVASTQQAPVQTQYQQTQVPGQPVQIVNASTQNPQQQYPPGLNSQQQFPPGQYPQQQYSQQFIHPPGQQQFYPPGRYPQQSYARGPNPQQGGYVGQQHPRGPSPNAQQQRPQGQLFNQGQQAGGPLYTGQTPIMYSAGAQTTPVIIKDGVSAQNGQVNRGVQHGKTKDQYSGPTQSKGVSPGPPTNRGGQGNQYQNVGVAPDVTQTPSQQQGSNGSPKPSGPVSQSSVKDGTTSRNNSHSPVRHRSEDSELDYRPRSDSTSSTPRTGPHMSSKKLEEKVARLERHLEALYALPNNPDLLDMEDAHGMSVSDMWQVIQLNNRVAAAEAAIQKMATLIEDLARQMKGLRQNYETNIQQFFDMKGQFDPMYQQMVGTQALIDKMKDEMEAAKNKLKRDIDKLAQATGVTLSRVPSFMTASELDKPTAWETGLTNREVLLDANGNAIVGVDGKPVLVQPTKTLVGPDGRPLMGPNGKPLTNNMVQEYKLPDGSKLFDNDGNPVIAIKSQLLQEKDGKIKLGPDGKMLYTDVGQIALGPDGMPIMSPEGNPVFYLPGKSLKGEGGKTLYGADGKPIKVTAGAEQKQLVSGQAEKPFIGPNGQPLMTDEIVLGPNGVFLPGPDGNPIPIQTSQGLIQLGTDGRPLVGQDGKLVYSKRGSIIMGPEGKPLIGPDKKPLKNAVGQLLVGPDGKALMGPDGKPYLTPSGSPVYHKIGQILLEPTGTPLVGPDNEFLYSTLGEIKFDEFGRPMFNPDGSPIYSNFGQSLIGPDGKPLLIAPPGLEYGGLGQGMIEIDENGVPIYLDLGNVMLGPDGNPIMGPDGQPLRHHMGQLLLDTSGKMVMGPTGEPLYLTMGQINIDSSGTPMVGPDGKLLFSNHGQLMIQPNGTPVLGPDGRPGYAKQGTNVLSPDGQEVFGVDGKPIVLVSRPQKPGSPLKGPNGNPLLGPDGQPLLSNQVLLGPDGNPMFNYLGNPILLFDAQGGHITLGPDGKPLLKADGTPRYSTKGDIILGPDGQPLVGPQGPLNSHMGEIGLGPDGQPIMNPDGSVLYTNLGSLVLDEDGKPVLGPDGRPRYNNIAQIMIGEDGKPVYGANGKPLYATVDTLVIGEDGKLTSSMFQNIKDTFNESRGPQAGLNGMTPEECRRNPELCQSVQTDTTRRPLYEEGTSPVPVGMIDAEICQELKNNTNLVGVTDFDLHKKALSQDMVRRYCELQGMQRQIVNDIQDKMEAMYNKLMREIANQQMTTSPYMALGPGLGRCMGPGICSGHGMPTGTAVCQFPALNEGSVLASAVKGRSEPCPYCHGAGRNPCGMCRYCQGTGIFRGSSRAVPCVASDTSIFPGSSRRSEGTCEGKQSRRNGPYQYSTEGPSRSCNHGLQEFKICGGPSICPGASICPTCKDDELLNLKSPRKRVEDSRAKMMSDSGICEDEKDPDGRLMEILRKECKTMILLPKDLEDLRQRVKREGKLPTVFDEMDVLERLHTLWEGVIALKHNDEALAVRIIKLDAAIKCLPKANIVERLQKIPLENLDAIAAASPDKPMIIPSSTSLSRMSEEVDCDLLPRETGNGAVEKERGKRSKRGIQSDLQPVMSNITNLLAESSHQKDKLDEILDAMKNFEQSMVTKHMLMDALGEKADKEHVSSKVGYEEFGNSIEDLTSRIQNLLIEVYQKNENWKTVTDHLGEELSSKLDKVELAPIRAYFKSHLKALEDRVNLLIRQLDEPDPAGTRKKLLKDYNCISCDRHTNISGITNTSHLPHFGGIMGGHNTPSQRAFDLHRMRQQKMCRYDPEGRDMNFLCKDLQACGDRGFASSNFGLNNSDMAHLVNRYVGGSHTSVPAAERISAMHRRSKGDYLGVEQEDTSPAVSGRAGKKSSLLPAHIPPPRFDYPPDVFDE